MKNLIRVAAAAAIILGFTTCQKEGVFNPKKKISEIYSAYEFISYGDDGEEYYSFHKEKQLEQVWTWDNDRLKSIEYKNYNYWCPNDYGVPTSSDFTYFKYNGTQLSQIIDGYGTVFKYTYQKSKLDKIEAWDENDRVQLFEFERKNAKISKITITFFNNYVWFPEDGMYKSPSTPKRFSPVLQLLLPEVVCTQLSQQMSDLHTAKVSNSSKIPQNAIQYILELQWKGNNVKEITYYEAEQPNIKYITSCEYDKKKNPFHNDFSGMSSEELTDGDATLQQLSVNNIITMKGPYQRDPITITHVYEDNYPVESVWYSAYFLADYSRVTATFRDIRYYKYK